MELWRTGIQDVICFIRKMRIVLTKIGEREYPIKEDAPRTSMGRAQAKKLQAHKPRILEIIK